MSRNSKLRADFAMSFVNRRGTIGHLNSYNSLIYHVSAGKTALSGTHLMHCMRRGVPLFLLEIRFRFLTFLKSLRDFHLLVNQGELCRS